MRLKDKVCVRHGGGEWDGSQPRARFSRGRARTTAVWEVVAENSEETAARVRAAGGEGDFLIPCDVADEASVQAAAVASSRATAAWMCSTTT